MAPLQCPAPRRGFVRALTGWHEALDAKAFQLEQAAAQVITTVLVLINGLIVASIMIAVFLVLIQLINGASAMVISQPRLSTAAARRRRQRGSLMVELLVALAFLVGVLFPLAYSFVSERRLARAYYQRAVAMEIVDGEMEALLAGQWRAFPPGTHDYRCMPAPPPTCRPAASSSPSNRTSSGSAGSPRSKTAAAPSPGRQSSNEDSPRSVLRTAAGAGQHAPTSSSRLWSISPSSLRCSAHGYAAMYRCIDSSIALRRNADDITSALHAGERWRADVRSATNQSAWKSRMPGSSSISRARAAPVVYRFSTNAVSPPPRRRPLGAPVATM